MAGLLTTGYGDGLSRWWFVMLAAGITYGFYTSISVSAILALSVDVLTNLLRITNMGLARMYVSANFMLVLSVCIGGVLSIDLFCDGVCTIPQELTGEGTQLLKFRCGCFNDKNDSTDTSSDDDNDDDDNTNPDDRTPAQQQLFTVAETRKYPHTETPKPTTTKPTTTTDICHYLCSIQMGGDACNCNNPSLPGK